MLSHFDRKELTLIACQCARIALAFENGTATALFLAALDAAEAWANDRGTIEAVRKANAALYEVAPPGAFSAVYAAASVAYEVDPVGAADSTIRSACQEAENVSTLNGGWPHGAATGAAMRELCYAVIRGRLFAAYTPHGRQLSWEESQNRLQALSAMKIGD